MHISKPLASGLTYSLGRSLYIPLTSRCNTLTLPQTRGPHFLLPAEVVSALCRVRDAENQKEQWKHWCMYLDTSETPQLLPKAEEPVAALKGQTEEITDSEDGLQPSVNELFMAVQENIGQQEYQSVVFAGEGEPTLRPIALVALAKKLKNIQSPPLRLTTNGLMSNDPMRSHVLQSNAISSVSVALMTHDSDQYDELMKPVIPDDATNTRSHERVCQFIQEALTAGLAVEVTAVEHPDVDKHQTEQYAASLGVTEPVRWRSYFP
ncbi:Inherit from COG: radical SAM domain protein [Seminavis robusta]|uniref:Inherit from COG: radical SAM domain protein n=1 Tax=Seminavis robusta TaxID=568900 RepID=A0A9N8ESF9_9STRA|nr:Inherit from COG: radical SAM domain protein [Seminavis robusta]|eukprot:Sro1565_g282830.1 Inherit from COG: radical SAM domain protein (265) ;mRNA; f:10330-11124